MQLEKYDIVGLSNFTIHTYTYFTFLSKYAVCAVM